MNHIIFSGDRDYKDTYTIINTLQKLDSQKDIIVQGGCRGVDTIVKNEAIKLKFQVKTENAKWEEYGKSAGPKRNRLMLEKYKPISKVYLIHDHIEKSKGTKNMLNLCKKMKIPYEIIKTKVFIPIKTMTDLETVEQPPDYYTELMKRPGLVRILTEEELKRFEKEYPEE
jgi:hypothetical protein